MPTFFTVCIREYNITNQLLLTDIRCMKRLLLTSLVLCTCLTFYKWWSQYTCEVDYISLDALSLCPTSTAWYLSCSFFLLFLSPPWTVGPGISVFTINPPGNSLSNCLEVIFWHLNPHLHQDTLRCIHICFRFSFVYETRQFLLETLRLQMCCHLVNFTFISCEKYL